MTVSSSFAAFEMIVFAIGGRYTLAHKMAKAMESTVNLGSCLSSSEVVQLP